jgi:general secretion pathway protein J
MMRRRAAGFTLLELLIAIALFGVVATLAQGGLQAVLRAHERTEAATRTLAALRHTWLLLEQDMAAVTARPLRDGSNQQRPAFVLAPGRIEFTRRRAGDELPQRVEYRLMEGRLMRFEWPVGDLAPDAVPRSGVVLEEIESAALRIFINGAWTEDWPPPGVEGTSGSIPAAVEIQLAWQGRTLRWLFPVTA